MQLEKKVAVVTGAARGIGQTIALAYAKEGAGLSLWDIDDAGLKQTAAEIQETGGESLSVRTDVTRRDEITAAIQATLGRFGRIDVLVNSAALKMSYVVPGDPRAAYPFWEIDPERWRRLLDVNITGAFLCCQHVAQRMVQQGSGAIINITSANETKLRRGYSPYGASKAALEAMTISISKELDPQGVRVNLLQPGGTVNLRGENDPSLLPYDIMVSAAVYLASDDSKGLSGVMIIGKDWIEG